MKLAMFVQKMCVCAGLRSPRSESKKATNGGRIGLLCTFSLQLATVLHFLRLFCCSWLHYYTTTLHYYITTTNTTTTARGFL